MSPRAVGVGGREWGWIRGEEGEGRVEVRGEEGDSGGRSARARGGAGDGPPLVFVQDGPAVYVLVVWEAGEAGIVDEYVVYGAVGRAEGGRSRWRERGGAGDERYVEETTTGGVGGGGVIGTHERGDGHCGSQKGKRDLARAMMMNTFVRLGRLGAQRRAYALRGAGTRTCPSCGASLPTALPVCSRCRYIGRVDETVTHHALLGLPYEPNPFVVDTGKLRQRFLEAQRLCHPDGWATRSEVGTVASVWTWTQGTKGDRDAAQAASHAVNTAYKTLLSPMERIGYVLQRNGRAVDETEGADAALIAEVLETREAIEQSSGDALARLGAVNQGKCPPATLRCADATQSSAQRRWGGLRTRWGGRTGRGRSGGRCGLSTWTGSTRQSGSARRMPTRRIT